MKIEFGKTKCGRTVYNYTLKNENYMSVRLSSSQINCCELQIAFGNCMSSLGSRPRDEK